MRRFPFPGMPNRPRVNAYPFRSTSSAEKHGILHRFSSWRPMYGTSSGLVDVIGDVVLDPFCGRHALERDSGRRVGFFSCLPAAHGHRNCVVPSNSGTMPTSWSHRSDSRGPPSRPGSASGIHSRATSHIGIGHVDQVIVDNMAGTVKPEGRGLVAISNNECCPGRRMPFEGKNPYEIHSFVMGM